MTSVQQPHTTSKTRIPGHAFPWRIEPCVGGVDIVNANGEQVALFETREDAEFVLSAVHTHLRMLAEQRKRQERVEGWTAEEILRREG